MDGMLDRIVDCLATPGLWPSNVSQQELGQKKLGKVVTPDPWKTGARNTTESGGVKVGGNKLLSKKGRFTPYSQFNKCRICKQSVHQTGSHYCQVLLNTSNETMRKSSFVPKFEPVHEGYRDKNNKD
eukprot:Seg265.2 transcript_id=Seg265.2/GoldUCD/mRNA.D3Y31 product="Cysteine-rich PDZ-binding protein" protein_id=Seg265.2/GoldUCD/D3Y31